MRRVFLVLAFAFGSGSAAAALAEPAEGPAVPADDPPKPADPVAPTEPVEPTERLILNTTLIGRANPTGLDLQGQLTWKEHIGDSQELLWKTRYWSVSGGGAINPANWTARVSAEVEPIAVFQLKAQYEARGFFGNFGAVVSGKDGSLPITDDALALAAKRNENHAALAQTLTLQPTLQAKLGPIAAQDIFAAQYGFWTTPPGNRVVYDPGVDMLVPANGFALTNTALVAYVGDNFLVGALHQYLAPIDVGFGNDVHRVGAVGSFTFWDSGVRAGLLNKATVTAVALWNVQQRGRPGFIPTAVLVVTADSDLL